MFSSQLIAQRIKAAAKQQKRSVKSVLEACGLNPGLVYDIEKRGLNPSTKVLLSIADELKVSVAYLIGETDDPNQPNEFDLLDNVSFALFGQKGKLSEDQLEEIRNFAKFLKSQEEDKKRSGD